MPASWNVQRQVEVPARPESIALARRIVTIDLPSWTAPDDVDTLKLLASEVVTNAVRHSGVGPTESITLRTDVDGERIRVEVEDPGEGFEWPEMIKTPAETSGRGLHLVSQTARHWGLRAGPRPPTVVWFELPLSR